MAADGRPRRPRQPRESFAERRERRAAVDDPAVVLEAAARFLEARSRSVAEVRRRLTGAGYRAELVDGAIDRMTELGMLDDELFARSWVESRDRARPRGERAIREELRQKGIERETIDAVLGDRRSAPRMRPPAATHRLARIERRQTGCWPSRHERSPGSRTRASGGSAPTRCSHGADSTRKSAARRPPRSWRMSDRSMTWRTPRDEAGRGRAACRRPRRGRVDTKRCLGAPDHSPADRSERMLTWPGPRVLPTRSGTKVRVPSGERCVDSRSRYLDRRRWSAPCPPAPCPPAQE